jgi:hypothetical protein
MSFAAVPQAAEELQHHLRQQNFELYSPNPRMLPAEYKPRKIHAAVLAETPEKQQPQQGKKKGSGKSKAGAGKSKAPAGAALPARMCTLICREQPRVTIRMSPAEKLSQAVQGCRYCWKDV